MARQGEIFLCSRKVGVWLAGGWLGKVLGRLKAWFCLFLDVFEV